MLVVHLLFILWVALGAFFSRGRPILRWSHMISLVYAIPLAILEGTCPLTPLENWLRDRAGIPTYMGGFLLHYLDALVYPNVPPLLLTVGTVALCLFNVGVYIARYRRRHIVVW